MRAAYFEAHGGREVLKVGELPTPEPGPGEVRVRTVAFALNHLDVWVRRGWKGLELTLPHIGGSDGAGVVDAVGPGVSAWKPGDEVVLSAGYFCTRCRACLEGKENLCESFHLFGEHRNGTGAEYFVVPERNLLKKPEGLSWEEAAAIGVTFLTAWHMLVTRARLRLDETVLVQGASAGVGVAAIQIAKLHGARVIALTSSEEKAARARDLGADEVVNYRTEDAKARLRSLAPKGVDIVFEHVGEATWELSVKALRKGGRLVTCGATTGPHGHTDLRLLFTKQIDILGSTMGTRAELDRVLYWAGHKRIVPIVDRVLPIDEIAEGHRLLEEAEHFGKIVVRP